MPSQPRFLPPKNGCPLTIGYIGSSNPWNVRSVEIFDADIAPKLESLPPGQKPRLLLFGSVARATTQLRAFQPMGMVDDVQDAYEMMDLVVNPMIGGTGLKIKTVEALAYGRLTLSTRSGGAGLEHIHPDLGHEDIASLSARVVELARNPEAVETEAALMREQYVCYYDVVRASLTDMLGVLADACRQIEKKFLTFAILNMGRRQVVDGFSGSPIRQELYWQRLSFPEIVRRNCSSPWSWPPFPGRK